MEKQKRTYDKTNFTAYLGGRSQRVERIEAIKRLAERYADGNVSELVQKIADGKITLIPTESDKTA